MTQYAQGKTLIAIATFRDRETEEPVNPERVIFSTRIANAAVSSIVWTEDDPDERIENPEVGRFTCAFFLGGAGAWAQAWEGILDGLTDTKEILFEVTRSRIPPTAPS